MLERCRGRWRVIVDPDVREFFERRGFLEELEEWRKGLERSLNRDLGRHLGFLGSLL